MTNDKFHQQLRPMNWGTFDCEPFEDYRERVKPLLPSWPLCPLEQWLYRHYADAVSEYGWLDFRRLHFIQEIWSCRRIFDDISTYKMKIAVDGLGYQITDNPRPMRSWLQEYILREKTWPVPIIVLENPIRFVSPRGDVLGQPYHLLEGHLRLGYFRRLFRRSPDEVLPHHEIWKVVFM